MTKATFAVIYEGNLLSAITAFMEVTKDSVVLIVFKSLLNSGWIRKKNQTKPKANSQYTSHCQQTARYNKIPAI